MLKKILFFFVIFILSIFLVFFGVGGIPQHKGITFFAELAGLIIPHLTFFLVSYFWGILFAPLICEFFNMKKNYQTIAFIPIFTLWIFYFVIYVLDYGISFFYANGGYETLRKIDFL
ncbi:hypothetical protein BXA09_06915 [Campylobacter upsaliensis]|nr:hypothetical protein [Campylobacter upsaliensis]EAI4101360.1 hypothetical protein [Campylobacter jejuni]EAH4720790.1 hypothetical protein [Campylobacter upsaliensis]EAH5553651.1 hypothetical protein [Campylobacter upsaliensis]EAH8338397.1 hypothetical protein [Campylobacter upsaliensis]EAI0665754.1 hypothetical protein [Campylobacter upsaliensis]